MKRKAGGLYTTQGGGRPARGAEGTHRRGARPRGSPRSGLIHSWFTLSSCAHAEVLICTCTVREIVTRDPAVPVVFGGFVLADGQCITWGHVSWRPCDHPRLRAHAGDRRHFLLDRSPNVPLCHSPRVVPQVLETETRTWLPSLEHLRCSSLVFSMSGTHLLKSLPPPIPPLPPPPGEEHVRRAGRAQPAPSAPPGALLGYQVEMPGRRPTRVGSCVRRAGLRCAF